MSMMTSQSKTQNSKYLEQEIFFLQIKKNHNKIYKGYNIAKKYFRVEVTFN